MMLSDCQTCRFCSSGQHHGAQIGCAVNPVYWLQWNQFRSAATRSNTPQELIACHDYEAIKQATSSNLSTTEKLIGVWDYQVSIVQSCYRLQISVNNNDELTGRYLVPSTDDSMFQIKLYESLRGRPMLSIVQIHYHPSIPYHAVLAGRLDSDDLITGSFVDLDDNRGTFTLTKWHTVG